MCSLSFVFFFFKQKTAYVSRISDWSSDVCSSDLISWPEHVTIFTVPVRVAVQYGVRLIVWGENPQNEYGGPAAASQDNILTRRWLEEFGGLLGLRVSDLLEVDGIEPRHLIQYTYPSDEMLACVGVTGIFLGYYFPWDGWTNALLAQADRKSTRLNSSH